MATVKLILTIIQVLGAVFLTFVVLAQSGKSAGLSGAIAGGADTFLSKNKAKSWDAKLARWTKVGLGNEAAGLSQPLQQRPPLGILRPLPSFPQEKHSGLLRHNGASFVFGFPSHGMSSLDKYAGA